MVTFIIIIIISRAIQRQFVALHAWKKLFSSLAFPLAFFQFILLSLSSSSRWWWSKFKHNLRDFCENFLHIQKWMLMRSRYMAVLMMIAYDLSRINKEFSSIIFIVNTRWHQIGQRVNKNYLPRNNRSIRSSKIDRKWLNCWRNFLSIFNPSWMMSSLLIVASS